MDRITCQHLGDELRYNVYAAELIALHISVPQWQENNYPNCRIFTDSQAAETSICQSCKQSGQTFIRSTIDLKGDLTTEDRQRLLEVIWIPGHHGIAGNEHADADANRVALDLIIS